MKKQELIKHIEDLPYKEGPIVDKIDISRKGLLELVKQLDEPGKVTIPQFVADWLEQSDWREETLGEQSVFDVLDNLKNDSKNGYYENVNRWIDGNGDLFARAWLDGYEVEKEKRYLVKMKNILDRESFLNLSNTTKIWFFGDKKDTEYVYVHHTRKELEEADFGWVFDCPGVQIEEVK
jgi:hypothetical protein|uniref:DUF1642 domain-containing protein n=1 Tax=Siphoviridae sp. cttnq1 TaxID=2826495 RepID=A0A8S5QZN3_9CAUD|nr:MAG TPA: Protein of unknown function (DUF1642) [Siphoviridae sp. cttnq1]